MSEKLPTKVILREYAESLFIAICIALFLRVVVISAYKIPTGSMTPTLKTGDFVFAYKLAYGVAIPFTDDKLAQTYPDRGDVVVFRFPGNESVNYVKRVVGLPGDRILIKNKKILINEKESDYQAASADLIRDIPGHEDDTVVSEGFNSSRHFIMTSQVIGAASFGPIVVPPGQIFVLGDNRDSSDDSRYWGTVPLGNLEGRVVLVWMSFDWLSRWGNERLPTVRWERVLRAVR